MAASSAASPQSTLQSAFAEIELSTLRFLAVKGDCFQTQFGQRATNLTWLRWCDFPYTTIPSWLISMENLTVLELKSGRLEEWPVCDKQLSLKELILEETRLSKISFPETIWPHLERLELCRNWNLMELEHLPTTLVVLNLRCSSKLRISSSFHLPRLENVNVSLCGQLNKLPNMLSSTSLETLEVDFCPQLESIQSLEHLRKLHKLNICFCYRLRQLSDVSCFASLKTLEVHHCPQLQNLHGLEQLCKLKNLNISHCFQLKSLPNLSGLTSLERLNAHACIRLQMIRGAEHLFSLKQLNISECCKIDELSDLSGLNFLESLEAEGCWKLRSIDGLNQLKQLTLLTLSAAEGHTAILKSIQPMQKLPSKLLFSTVRAGFDASSFPGITVSDFSHSGEAGCWKSEMNAWTDGNPCSAFMVCIVVERLKTAYQPGVFHSVADVTQGGESFEMYNEPSHRPPVRWTHKVDTHAGATDWISVFDGGAVDWVCVAVFSGLVEPPDPTSTFYWRSRSSSSSLIKPKRGCTMRLSNGSGQHVSEIILKLLGLSKLLSIED